MADEHLRNLPVPFYSQRKNDILRKKENIQSHTILGTL